MMKNSFTLNLFNYYFHATLLYLLEKIAFMLQKDIMQQYIYNVI